MAWRSSGTTNDEMVDNLKRFQVISSIEVEDGFRNVDRRLFVPKVWYYVTFQRIDTYAMMCILII